MNSSTTYDVAIIGAGPAGLTSAYKLVQAGKRVIILEADATHVGGISKTVSHEGYRFDIGGHRFFSKSEEIEDLWTEILGSDLITRPRSSRIYYRGKLFAYPLKAFEALWKLGVFEATLCVLSYARAKLWPHPDPKSFEDWVTNHFGKRLFSIFFKTYTEKVWGMSCKDISADWAAQRIKGLSLASAIWHALIPRRAKNIGSIKTLIDSFRYPRLGPGMMWERCAELVKAAGGHLCMAATVTTCERREDGWRVNYRTGNGDHGTAKARAVISSMPMRELFTSLSPKPSPEALRAAAALRYRDFITVAVMAKKSAKFSDNWIYIHEPNVKVGRIQNFASWSPEMVPSPSSTCYGLEYFCFEGDGLWTMADQDLIALAHKELAVLGLVSPEDLLGGHVIRQAKAYPVYDDQYVERVEVLRAEIAAAFPGMHLIGRNGMHKYNNQDHAMMTGILTAKNIVAGSTQFDVWQVNQDAEYHEEASSTQAAGSSGLREVPRRLREQPADQPNRDKKRGSDAA